MKPQCLVKTRAHPTSLNQNAVTKNLSFVFAKKHKMFQPNLLKCVEKLSSIFVHCPLLHLS